MVWGGNTNGRIPATVLGQARGHLMHPAAAVSFTAMRLACFLATGTWLGITEAYRPFADQDRFFRARYTSGHPSGLRYAGTYWRKRPGAPAAAVPGTSNHGWALALDINNYGPTTGRVFRWLLDHAAAFGWSWVEGRAVDEPWHWVYVGSLMRPATSGITPIAVEPEPEPLKEYDMTIFYKPTNNSSPLPDGISRIWAGQREVASILYSDVWAVSDNGDGRRLLRFHWEHVYKAFESRGIPIPVVECTGNQLEQIIYAPRL